jgi:hypothetical protein
VRLLLHGHDSGVRSFHNNESNGNDARKSSPFATVATVVVKPLSPSSVPSVVRKHGFIAEGTEGTEREGFYNDGIKGGRRFRWGECPHEPLGSSKIQVSSFKAGRVLQT